MHEHLENLSMHCQTTHSHRTALTLVGLYSDGVRHFGTWFDRQEDMCQSEHGIAAWLVLHTVFDVSDLVIGEVV